jgi:hypothetical protein
MAYNPFLKKSMTLEIVTQIPVSSWFVPAFFEDILNKKIAGVALNILETVLDFILSWIYCPYNYLLQRKVERIHFFTDGTPLYDCTIDGISDVQKKERNGRLTLLGSRVLFSLPSSIEREFSQRHRTEFMVVREDPLHRAGWFQVAEQPQPFADTTRPMEAAWFINTSEIHRLDRQSPSFFLAQTVS